MRRTATAKILLTALTCGTAALALLAAFRAGRALPAWTEAGVPLLVALGVGWAGYFDSRRERARLTGEAAAAAERARELEFRLHLATAERQHAEAILYSISDAVLVTDPADDVVLANESAARTFEFDLSRVARSSGTPADALLRDPRILGLIRDMRNSRGGGAARRIVEHDIETPAGRRRFKVTLSPVAADRTDDTAETPAAGGVVIVLHDVTRERDVSEMKNEFVSMVSHELRTPLASIKAYVEMLIDGEAVDEKTTREFYDVIQNEANRLGRLIDNILSISRIESGLVKAERRPQPLNEIVREAIDVISPQAAHKQIRLVECLTPAPHRASVDKDMMYQAVLNLLSNSVKFTPDGGAVSVQTAVDAAARKVVVRVTDTGVGIAPRDLPFVFDKFYRAETGNRMASGTGLGLSLVKHIVEEVHGGRILVESHVGKGSCFGFELELCE